MENQTNPGFLSLKDKDCIRSVYSAVTPPSIRLRSPVIRLQNQMEHILIFFNRKSGILSLSERLESWNEVQSPFSDTSDAF